LLVVGLTFVEPSASANPASPSLGKVLAALHGSAKDPYSDFGVPVAISGKTAVVGSPGATYIFQDQHATWSLVSIVRHPKGSKGSFGSDVAISGTTMAIAGSSDKEPVVFVYSKNGKQWPKVPAAILPDPSTMGNGFGESVAVDGATVVVGYAPVSSSQTGGADVYAKTRAGWPTNPTSSLVDPMHESTSFIQTSVGISGSTIVVGESSDEGSSEVYVYDEGPSGWPMMPTTTLPDPSGSDDSFGDPLAISSSTIVVGAVFANSAAGAAYLYVDGSGGWPTTPTVSLVNPSTTPLFGSSVAISGNTAIVAPWGGGNSPNVVYVYVMGSSGWPLVPTASLFDPSTSGTDDYFGDDVAIAGSRAIVGAPGDRRAAAPAAAYIFEA